jgi:hypothetical protein
MEERKLTRKDLRRCWRAWMMHNLSSMSFERLESFGFCLSMLPVAKNSIPMRLNAPRCCAVTRRSTTLSRKLAQLLTVWRWGWKRRKPTVSQLTAKPLTP